MADLDEKVDLAQEAELNAKENEAVDAADEAPFLADDSANDSADSADSAGFAEVIAQAQAKDEEKKAAEKAKKGSRKSSKKSTLDLKDKSKRVLPSDPTDVPMRWYILQAFSGFEQRVAQALKERIKIHNMEEYFGEVLVPKEKVKDMKDGKKRESERKFFPGYVMVEMKMTSDSWQLVKHTERVLGFIGGTPECPLPITKMEADRILDRLKETADAPRPKTLFEVGEEVRATNGPFKDFTGIVEKVDYEKNRLVVSISIFGRSTPVDLEFGQVEKDI